MGFFSSLEEGAHLTVFYCRLGRPRRERATTLVAEARMIMDKISTVGGREWQLFRDGFAKVFDVSADHSFWPGKFEVSGIIWYTI